MKETKNSALTTAQAFHYQSIIALQKCFEMKEGDKIYIEKDGDVSHISNNPNAYSQQIEVKDVKAPLTNNHESFWKTLKNWLRAEFDHSQYKNLILHTTQSFGKKTMLAKWNEQNAQEKLQILKSIYANSSKDSEIKIIQKEVIETDENLLLNVIDKVVLVTESENKDAILNEIKHKFLRGIPESNHSLFINGLIGFIYSSGDKKEWSISYSNFTNIILELTSQFSRKEFPFPEFNGSSATEKEIIENETKKFVIKIRDIDYEDVVPEAIGNWLEFNISLSKDLDYSPVYHKKTKQYQQELVFQFKSRYRMSKRNAIPSQDFYEEIMSSLPRSIDNHQLPYAYRNGAMHDVMDNTDLKWDTGETKK